MIFALLMIFTCFVISHVTTKLLIKIFTTKSILDIPNNRSNHVIPTPIGGGLAVITAFFIGCIPLVFLFTNSVKAPFYILISLTILCMISFYDDIKPVPIVYRFTAHIIASILGATVVLDNGSIFNSLLPTNIEFLIISLVIVIFLNLYNFMDGIDGITGSQTIYLTLSLALFYYLLGFQVTYIYVAVLLAACVMGFLISNWHPAKIFIGDAGSITIGYIIAILLLILAAKGFWLQAIILPSYYFADAGYVLLIRALKLERIWQSHNKHFFQQAVRNGYSHSQIVLKIIVMNLFLFSTSLVCLHIRSIILQIIVLCCVVIMLLFFIKKFLLKYNRE